MANPTSQSSPLPAADLSVGAWHLDPAASSVRIQHKAMWGLVNVKGAFTKLSGEGELLPDRSAHGTLTVDAASIDTKNAKRDVHLRSADFFDVDNHPTFTFTADSVTADNAGIAQVTGHLTVLGTTRPLEFTAQAAAATPTDVTLTGEVAVDRVDFGMGWNKGGMLKGLTTVTLSLRFTRH
ncbi:YceI family protein [Kitasatospora sp. GAS204B]|uniref:YceI family protein n=1 Tax=unclassified Kitasatospora TaxID=2633591 RepID=UPI002474123F|nr:YceI family protein [Kitasatospora sp. GAS204B]MDH6117580.1 polyisoprenoid-binding protein YceI [Kitasatospora sp. GAS204B]